MGWLSSSTTEKPDPVSRTDRQCCWESRDAYFTCLDNAGVIVPGKEGNACQDLNTVYQKNCAKSWVEYFNKRRVLAEQQKGMIAASTPRS